jgi:CheY-like chemotaxis protein
MQRIAIIADDKATRFTLHSMLVEGGYEPILIEGPRKLLAQLTAARPDLVLLDLMLDAWGDRLALAANIRRQPTLKDLPVIVVAASSSVPSHQATTLADLRCPGLLRPFDLDDLFAIIAGELLLTGRQAAISPA